MLSVGRLLGNGQASFRRDRIARIDASICILLAHPP
jgi:hypothetical protein